MQQGFIKLHRKIQDHWLYQEKRKFSRYEAWIDLIMMANHKQTSVLLGNELVQTQRGQVITSEMKLMKKWDWGKSRLRAFLEILENEKMIIKKSDRKKTIITICNYSIYHGSEEESRPRADHEQTMNRLSADTNKNVKNVKNNKYTRQYDEDSLYLMPAKFFVEQIRKNNPNFKEPNYQKWANDIRLMMEVDNRTEKEIRFLMKWVQEDDFEMANVLSPSKLRKRFDNLLLKVKAQKKKSIKVQQEEERKDIPIRKTIDFSEGEDWN